MGHPDQPETSYALPTFVAEDLNDFPQPGLPMANIGAYGFPELIFGAATLSTIYNSQDLLNSDIPLRTVRLALRYGIRAFDTSPYYGDSEVVLGQLLRAVSTEFPRQTYKLVSKCGRYGENEFDYTPQTIRKSVMRTLNRLGTTYLDVLLLHDVDFVCSPMAPIPRQGLPAQIWADGQAEEWGLIPGKEAKIWGTGDRRVVDALLEMQKLKAEGLVRAVGISGYTLPVLLRLGLLALHTLPRPLDAVLSFSHYTLQNSALVTYLNRFITDAKVSQVFCASPLSMGLLTIAPPEWHPAPPKLRQTAAKAYDRVREWPGELPNLAIGYAIKREGEIMGTQGKDVPTVIGLSNLAQVHEAVALWREVNGPTDAVPRRYAEGLVKAVFQESGFLDWSWNCPPFRRDNPIVHPK